jgi:integrase
MRGNITRRGERSWRIKFDVETSAAGERETKYVTVRGTKAQAEAEAAKIISGITTGQYVDASRETVAQFAERWLRDWAAGNVSNKTFDRYEQLLHKHVCARVGSLPIQKLRAANLQTVYAGMAADGLADRTRLHAHRVVHRMLRHATQWGVVHQNVAGLVDAPTVADKEIETLTAQQVQAVLQTLRGRSLYPVAATALATGMRRGELLALRWQDIDLDGAKLRVERSLEQTKRGGAPSRPPSSWQGRHHAAMPEPRRFPPPWSVEETDACFIIRDHNGQALACVLFRGRARTVAKRQRRAWLPQRKVEEATILCCACRQESR